ncbi:transposase domain-containing protein (plasmid) [Streptomyces sp. NBC_00841]|uniref:transposase domain-containing protein n=1 Tax=Streptomyces sp. NBC_01669 TaxID=2975909 RepID=UPI002B1CD11B|nr:MULTISPECIES: transposase domain-containing protein [unclassified Streptomyces]WSA04189.1 transposase domain-containing protein [Streptomyces sp. NBC_00841]WSA04734.1 transposase domain-containing protein [Streptomyces sp. NBC_00841]WSA05964.1 transposase domain-containing protein [Streptomyces sp. NBC_00841]
MREKSVITRTIEVAGGVYAPGHVGELTQVVDFALVDAVLEETGTRERRLRLLPSRVVVYFVLAVRNEVLRVRAGVKGPCR